MQSSGAVLQSLRVLWLFLAPVICVGWTLVVGSMDGVKGNKHDKSTGNHVFLQFKLGDELRIIKLWDQCIGCVFFLDMLRFPDGNQTLKLVSKNGLATALDIMNPHWFVQFITFWSIETTCFEHVFPPDAKNTNTGYTYSFRTNWMPYLEILNCAVEKGT